jgi:hypothetical protein
MIKTDWLVDYNDPNSKISICTYKSITNDDGPVCYQLVHKELDSWMDKNDSKFGQYDIVLNCSNKI